MLQATQEAPQGAQVDVQAADQWTHELLRLHMWASGGSPGTGGVGSNAKVEIFQDPSSYDRSASKFEEWWTKMRTWPDCHPKQFTNRDVDRDETPALKPQMYIVLSHLKGSKGAHYAKMELKKLADGVSIHHYWECFEEEIEGVFHPQL